MSRVPRRELDGRSYNRSETRKVKVRNCGLVGWELAGASRRVAIGESVVNGRLRV